MNAKKLLCDGLTGLLRLERRIDPIVRPALDAVFQKPLVALTQCLVRLVTPRPNLPIAAEQIDPDEAALAQTIVDSMLAFTAETYRGKFALRAGNTKTYGLVQARFEVFEALPDHLKVGILQPGATYEALVRLSGPGPTAPPDLDDNGILSIAVKLLGVPGPKLLDDETATQDFTGISMPTFTTPHVRANVKLQQEIGKGTPLWYFTNPLDSHFLDLFMSGLYSKTHSTPFDCAYYSCVPYLWGEGQAVKYRFRPLKPIVLKGQKLTPSYLAESVAHVLANDPVEFEFALQLQTDSRRMPIENASVMWQAPFIPVAKLTLLPQPLDPQNQEQRAATLSFNPWHSRPEHRPLGNQSRARKIVYHALSEFRQRMNATPHTEPKTLAEFESHLLR